MIRIEVTVDEEAFERECEAHVADDIMPALVDALNEVAKAAVVGIVGAIDTNLDRPSPYILDGINEYRRFGPVVAEAVGRVGDDVFVKGWTMPLGAPPGSGCLRTITTWRCSGDAKVISCTHSTRSCVSGPTCISGS